MNLIRYANLDLTTRLIDDMLCIEEEIEDSEGDCRLQSAVVVEREVWRARRKSRRKKLTHICHSR